MQRRTSLLTTLLNRLGRKAPSPPTVRAPARPFQAVSIFRGVHACEKARELAEHRFLAREAPRLPLAGCTMPEQCECVYIRHQDRRAGQRRLVDFGALSRPYAGRERRVRRGRRAVD